METNTPIQFIILQWLTAIAVPIIIGILGNLDTWRRYPHVARKEEAQNALVYGQAASAYADAAERISARVELMSTRLAATEQQLAATQKNLAETQAALFETQRVVAAFQVKNAVMERDNMSLRARVTVLEDGVRILVQQLREAKLDPKFDPYKGVPNE